ncbi:hypothetical protein BCS96_02325 [Vibrio breoganii]|uniref:hypothetical protein n=1 Tax=Vibrio breoganii TaxID=553239 RepID=UPI000C855D2B|nr:hypothetical protein [Vibrio breoganii]PMG37200.1 hypothetical protein BCU93_15675 [Vibrio breoganii]PML84474.1 hypothetical protein BCT68_08300 [Vibrio breoganii]PMM48767.1 hypothetical protein BCT52_04000 [Vibrio breoganii]PMM84343.1 hypothetical protein BCT45_09725 [Vibrio breoganii]PMO90206.1 hypothetical protein BCS98_02385 [Vibrio breoganii]
MKLKNLFLLLAVVGVSACSNNPRLGEAMTLVKNEQIYNPQATEQNKEVVPLGSGERAQSSIKGYNKGASKDIAISGFEL